MNTFGDLLRADRERLGLSQEQLAQQVGVSQQSIANWEANTSSPRAERRKRLQEVLGSDSLAVQFKGELARLEPAPRPNFAWIAEAAAAQKGSRLTVFAPAHDELLQELKKHLPEKLQQFVGKSINFGQHHRRYDYASGGVSAAILRYPDPPSFSPGTSARLAQRIVRLAMRVERNLPDPCPRSATVLFILTAAPAGVITRYHANDIFDASFLGITVTVCPSVQEVAKEISELEDLHQKQLVEFEAWLAEVSNQSDLAALGALSRLEQDTGDPPDVF